MSKKLLTFFLVCCILITPAQGLIYVTSDYDNDIWEAKKIEYEMPEEIPKNWYPLRQVIQEYLPGVYVTWIEKTRQIEIYSDNNYCPTLYYYDINNLPSDEMKVIDGVTYCSASFLESLSTSTIFCFANELYVYGGEIKESQIIKCTNQRFRNMLISTQYQMKLLVPETYELFRKLVNGGIIVVERSEVPSYLPETTVAYISPTVSMPIVKIVNCYYNYDRAQLAGVFAHEMYHVYEYQTWGTISEEKPTKYGDSIRAVFLLDKLKNYK